MEFRVPLLAFRKKQERYFRHDLMESDGIKEIEFVIQSPCS